MLGEASPSPTLWEQWLAGEDEELRGIASWRIKEVR